MSEYITNHSEVPTYSPTSLLHPEFTNCPSVTDWYDIPFPAEVINFCELIQMSGGKALAVGGYVRDAVMAKNLGTPVSPKDIDIEVYGISPQFLEVLLFMRSYHTDTVGKAFGITKIKIAGLEKPIDVSIPRRDSRPSGNSHTDIVAIGDPTMTISEAAQRRDIKINSFAFDPLTQTLYDPAHGLVSLEKKLIEATDPATFIEDPLRVLRVMQFAARFGFDIPQKTKDLCREMVERGDLDTEPKERITEELVKLLTRGQIPSIGLNFAREVGIVKRYWKELDALIGTPQDPGWHPEGDVWNHTLQVVDAAVLIGKRIGLDDDNLLILTLSALLHDTGKPNATEFKDGKWRAHGHEEAGFKPSQSFLDQLVIPNDIKRQILGLVPQHMHPHNFWREFNSGKNMHSAIRRLAVRLGKSNTSINMLLALTEADQRGRNPQSAVPLEKEGVPDLIAWQDWFAEIAKKLEIEQKAPRPILSGGEILDILSIKPGPWIGVVHSCIYADQIDGNLTTREEAISLVTDYYSQFLDLIRKSQPKDTNDNLWDEIRHLEDPRTVLSDTS